MALPLLGKLDRGHAHEGGARRNTGMPLVGINGWQRGAFGRVKRWGVLTSGALVLLVGAGELWSQEAVRGVPARTRVSQS